MITIAIDETTYRHPGVVSAAVILLNEIAIVQRGERQMHVNGTATASPPRARRRRPRSTPKPTSWAEFEATLVPTHKAFIDALQQRKRMNAAEAAAVMGIQSGKGLGGALGALIRRANAAALALPFRMQNGTYTWKE